MNIKSTLTRYSEYDGFSSKPGPTDVFSYSGKLNNYSTPYLHYHTYNQILYFPQGVSVLETNLEKTIQSGLIAVLIPAYVPHRSLIVGKEACYISLYFGQDIFDPTSNEIQLFQLSGIGESVLTRLSIRSDMLLKEEIERQCISLLINIIREDRQKKIPLPYLIVTKNKYVMHTIQFLENNYREPLNIKDIQKEIPLSYRQLMRLSHREIGMSPFQYLRTYRTLRASTELRTTEKSITEIALDNGFETFSVFFKEFKKCFGISPRQYRLKYKG